jgi:NDP-sugar pyrophosphorylase family protein
MRALVLSDVFDEHAFAPLHLDATPLALLPVVNVPAIEYTLQCLSQQRGLTEVRS